MYAHPDPVWVSQSVLSALRKRLRELDPRLNIRWEPYKCYWIVTERIARTGEETYCITWNKGLDGNTDGILKKLAAADFSRFKNYAEWEEHLDGGRREALEKKKREQNYARKATLEDYLERGTGVRQTFGPGGHRSRGFYKGQDDAMIRASADLTGRDVEEP